MSKPVVVENRFDFRGGRNTAISPDLLNPNELVDCTNARLSDSYGGFSKRSGSQRVHPNAFPASIRGLTQWDGPTGKQLVVVSNGDLYYRNGFSFNSPFTLVPAAGTPRTTLNQGAAAGWTGASNTLSGPVPTDTTVVAGSRIICKLGDPAINNNVDAVDDLYTITFRTTADGTAMSGTYAAIDSSVTIEVSTDGGGTYPTTYGPYSASASIGVSNSKLYSPTFTVSGAPAQVWVRLSLNLRVIGLASGNGTATLSVANGAVNYPATWSTGSARFSTTQPAMFQPFRASSSGAPLVLYIASGGHYFSWDGNATLTQLDPTNSAPLATNVLSYHTRMFAMSASSTTPGLLPKTIFWSKLGDATDFTTGAKDKGGSAVTDFLTGQQLVALEVIGSSLLMGTNDSVMRFTGHASDDIVISQDTEGITAEVGPVGMLALKRFENVAAMFTDRGPYVVTETYAEPSGEQLMPDWKVLDSLNLANSSIEYNRGKKELLFAVPRSADGGYPKTIYSQSVRLQAWQGPWIYPFDISCMCKYFDSTNFPNVLAGSTDGFIRLMDVGSLDDVLSDNTGGSNISMTVEFAVMHFELPGIKKALKWLVVQGTIPASANLVAKIAFDGASLTSFPIVSTGTDTRNYRTEVSGDASQGFRLRMQFVDTSALGLTINGFTLVGWNMQRTS